MTGIYTARNRQVGTWAGRPVLGSVGREYLATDLGSAGVLFRWSSLLGLWRLAHDQIIAFRDTAVVGAAGAGTQILSQLSIPAGLIMACGRISLQNSFSKSGATDAATNITVRIGITGTTSDTVIVSVANPMSAANRSWPAETMLRPLSSTSLAPGGGATLTSSFVGSGSGGIYASAITVPDMLSTALIFSASITMAGSTDTPTSQFVYLQGFAA